MKKLWKCSEIHQAIIPYLVDNHWNNIQSELMRKCIIQLFQLNNKNNPGDLTLYNKFLKDCNQKNVV